MLRVHPKDTGPDEETSGTRVRMRTGHPAPKHEHAYTRTACVNKNERIKCCRLFGRLHDAYRRLWKESGEARKWPPAPGRVRVELDVQKTYWSASISTKLFEVRSNASKVFDSVIDSGFKSLGL